MQYAVEANRHKPFEWGVHDCCTFAALAVQVQTGQNVNVTRPYKTIRGALREIKRLGKIPDYQTALTNVLCEPSSARTAHRGDLILMRDQPGEIGYVLGMTIGTHVVFPGLEGLIFQPLDFKKSIAYKIADM